MNVIQIRTKRKNEMIDVTHEIDQYITSNHIKSGMILLFVPHTTAAVTINENADPSVKRDMLFGLEQIVPNRSDYEHYEGNSDAHIKSSLVGVEQLVLVHDGRLVLGTWQGIYFCEFDGPRQRKLIIQEFQK